MYEALIMGTYTPLGRLLILCVGICFLDTGCAQEWQRLVCPIVQPYLPWSQCRLGENNQCTSDKECYSPGKVWRCCPSGTKCGVQCTQPKPAVGCPIPVDLGMLLDSSGSIGRRNWKKVQQFVKDVVDSYDVSEKGTHIGIITYSTNVSVDVSFDKYTGIERNALNLKRDIDIIPLQGGLTFMDRALNTANEELFVESRGMRKDYKKICLLLTDGIQTKDKDPFTPPPIMAQKLKARGIDIYSLGVGSNVEVSELIDMASSEEHVFNAKNFDELRVSVKQILEKQCTGCDQKLDIVFGIPNSQSLGQEGAQVKQIMSKLASLFRVKNTKAHIGVVTYNEDASLALPLDKEYTVAGLQKFINGMKFSSKHGFNTASAIRVAADHAFSTFAGVRQTRPKVFILLAPRTSSSSASEIKAAADKLKSNGIRLIILGVAGSADKPTYSAAVTQPPRTFLMDTVDYVDLNVATYEIANTACKAKYGKCPLPRPAVPGVAGTLCEVDTDCKDSDQLCCGDGSGGTACASGVRNCFVPFEMAIAIDVSETVSRRAFVEMKKFVRDLMLPYANSENNVHFGLMTFAGTTQKVTNGFRKFKTEQELQTMLDSIQKTNDPQRRVDITLNAASKEFFSMEGGTRHGHSRYLLVLVSSGSSPGSGDFKTASKYLDLLGVKRIAVGVSSDVPSTFLRDVASEDSLVFAAEEAIQLPDVIRNIQSHLCKEKPGKCPKVDSPDPNICHRAKVLHSEIPCGKSATKPGQNQKQNDWDCPGQQKCCLDPRGCYTICTFPPIECDKARDLLIMIENTDAIGGRRAFELAKTMAAKIVGAFDVSPENTHVAIGTYRGSARTVTRFNEGEAVDKRMLIEKLKKVAFQGGSSGSTSSALEAAKNDFFNPLNGARQAGSKTLVIIGSGSVKDPDRAKALAHDLQQNLIDVFAVTIGNNVNYPAMRDVVSEKALKNVFTVTSGDALEVQLRALVKTICKGAVKKYVVKGRRFLHE